MRLVRTFDPPNVLLAKKLPVTLSVAGPGRPPRPKGAETLKRFACVTFTDPGLNTRFDVTIAFVTRAQPATMNGADGFETVPVTTFARAVYTFAVRFPIPSELLA
jgi:hypothetical protein